jgi:hypothetical protein
VTLLLLLPTHPKLAETTVAPSRVSTPDIRFLKVTRTSLRRTISQASLIQTQGDPN